MTEEYLFEIPECDENKVRNWSECGQCGAVSYYESYSQFDYLECGHDVESNFIRLSGKEGRRLFELRLRQHVAKHNIDHIVRLNCSEPGCLHKIRVSWTVNDPELSGTDKVINTAIEHGWTFRDGNIYCSGCVFNFLREEE